MDNFNISKHISGAFNAELEDLRNRVMAMGGLVEQQLADALEVMQHGDETLAEKVVNRDRKVNTLEVGIDEECTRIIAKRQPAASDLRLVLAISKAVTDLERIGDAAERIARTAAMQGDKRHRAMVMTVDAMGRLTQRMLHDVLDAFARMDVEAAMQIHQQDVRIDDAYEGVVRQLMTFMMEDPRSIPHVLDVLWAARSLERIGDRCQNICEYVIYYVKGTDVRHLDFSKVEDLLK
ncbi:phosphate signaling complex protein PhoU [Ferrimonas gelatinilytica]|uniref:Phosphate-specific transport system accessory protein PhoU n=1 Tax=Ferrimonas gelatinilytica TaxID=1255257 RepID=A0ABP9RTX2_9GAMM